MLPPNDGRAPTNVTVPPGSNVSMPPPGARPAPVVITMAYAAPGTRLNRPRKNAVSGRRVPHGTNDHIVSKPDNRQSSRPIQRPPIAAFRAGKRAPPTANPAAAPGGRYRTVTPKAGRGVCPRVSRRWLDG